jgi:hypothetical protein
MSIKKKNKQRDIGNDMPSMQQPKKLINPNIIVNKKKQSYNEDIEIRSNKSGKSSYEDDDEDDDDGEEGEDDEEDDDGEDDGDGEGDEDDGGYGDEDMDGDGGDVGGLGNYNLDPSV